MEQLSIFDIGIEKTPVIEQTSDKIDLSSWEIIRQESFMYTRDGWLNRDGTWHVIFASVALLDNCTVFIKEWFTYDFAYTFKDMNSAYSFYANKLAKIYEYSDTKLGVFKKINIHPELGTLYYCKDNMYGAYEYWNNNFNPGNSILTRIKQV